MGIHRRARRALTAVTATVLLVAGTLFTAAAAEAQKTATPPSQIAVMASLGDSITQAAMTCSALTSCPANSWSTGTTTTVQSHFLRLKTAGATTLTAFNDAVSGAKSAALPGQAQTAVSQGAKYVTIEIGANDACTSTVAQMTPTETFRANVTAALGTLGAGGAEIFVASVPSLMKMYELNKSNFTARATWSLLKICQSMLANPTSTKAADVQRRADVEKRVVEYNAVLAAACAEIATCRYDGGAVYNAPMAKSDISTRDYFHPSLAGQAKLASVTWPTTQWVS